jgi:hypothetical protein
MRKAEGRREMLTEAQSYVLVAALLVLNVAIYSAPFWYPRLRKGGR